MYEQYNNNIRKAKRSLWGGGEEEVALISSTYSKFIVVVISSSSNKKKKNTSFIFYGHKIKSNIAVEQRARIRKRVRLSNGIKKTYIFNGKFQYSISSYNMFFLYR